VKHQLNWQCEQLYSERVGRWIHAAGV